MKETDITFLVSRWTDRSIDCCLRSFCNVSGCILFCINCKPCWMQEKCNYGNVDWILIIRNTQGTMIRDTRTKYQ
jgi:hypothetical protein